jgi:hypothetical protein
MQKEFPFLFIDGVWLFAIWGLMQFNILLHILGKGKDDVHEIVQCQRNQTFVLKEFVFQSLRFKSVNVLVKILRSFFVLKHLPHTLFEHEMNIMASEWEFWFFQKLSLNAFTLNLTITLLPKTGLVDCVARKYTFKT